MAAGRPGHVGGLRVAWARARELPGPARSGAHVVVRGLRGAAFVGAWVVFLAATGALRGFIDYYVIFGPGHTLSGAEPACWVGRQLGPTVEFVVPVALLLLTVARVAVQVRRRRPWTSRDWVMVAAASFVLLYYQKVLARADQIHVAEVFIVTLPLVLLWLIVGRRGPRRRASGASCCEHSDGPARTGPRWPARRARCGPRRAPSRHPGHRRRARGAGAEPRRHRSRQWRRTTTSPRASEPVRRPARLLRRRGHRHDHGPRPRHACSERYAGAGGPVFDFNDEPGLLYYLLNRVPGTRFYHVSMADTGVRPATS